MAAEGIAGAVLHRSRTKGSGQTCRQGKTSKEKGAVMPTRTPALSLKDAFAILERAAVAGDRCPVGGTSGLTSGLTTQLAIEGTIKIEIYARNFRRVTILVGPNAGKTTADPPNKD